MTNRVTTVGVVGLGYAGLPLALALADGGYEVVGVDIDEGRIATIEDGRSPVDDVSDEEIRRHLPDRLTVSSSYDALGGCEAVAICVPTPLSEATETPDLSYVANAVDRLASVIGRGTTVVLESTVYPGATKEVVATRLEKEGLVVGQDVFVAFSPERIDPGNEDYTVREIPKVIGGITNECADHAEAVYQPVFEEIVRVDSATEAELVKLLENTFRAVNIAFVNELAMVAHALDIDVWNVIDAAATKPFGFMPFYPGPGFGGHCIPIDPAYLTWRAHQLGIDTQFIDLADRINRKMPEYVVNRVSTFLNRDGIPLLDADILVLGVAYKPDVPDTRLAPAYDIINQLRSNGVNVQYFDPHVPTFQTDEWKYHSQELSEEFLGRQDCILVVTDHTAIDFEYVVDHSRRIFDTRNAVPESEGAKIESL